MAQADINDLDHDIQFCNPPAAKCPALEISDCSEVAIFVRSSSISAQSKYDLLVSHFKPTANYEFPKHSGGRSFKHHWLLKFPRLAYSKQENGGFCLPCVLFRSSGYHGSDPAVLVSQPLIAFHKALELFHKHAEKGYHEDAVIKYDEFLQVMSNQKPTINNQLSQAMTDRIASNRQKLSSIIKTTVLCGRQNIALHGHCDNATDIEKDPLNTENQSNFRALLNFRVDAGDTVLGEHLKAAAKNATYTSPVIQNQIIDVLEDQIRSEIIRRVQKAKWFTVIADEVTDVPIKSN